MDCFLENKNIEDIEDMKAVFSYLEENDFPIDYINHFEEQFRLEIEKSTKNKEKSNNFKKNDEDEEIKKDKDKEFDMSF